MRSQKRKQWKNANNETEHEEHTVTNDPIVFMEPIYFNIF